MKNESAFMTTTNNVYMLQRVILQGRCFLLPIFDLCTINMFLYIVRGETSNVPREKPNRASIVQGRQLQSRCGISPSQSKTANVKKGIWFIQIFARTKQNAQAKDQCNFKDRFGNFIKFSRVQMKILLEMFVFGLI